MCRIFGEAVGMTLLVFHLLTSHPASTLWCGPSGPVATGWRRTAVDNATSLRPVQWTTAGSVSATQHGKSLCDSGWVFGLSTSTRGADLTCLDAHETALPISCVPFFGRLYLALLIVA